MTLKPKFCESQTSFAQIEVATMKKKMRLVYLAVLLGLMIGFAPDVVKVLTAVFIVAWLWNEWDEYEVRRASDD